MEKLFYCLIFYSVVVFIAVLICGLIITFESVWRKINGRPRKLSEMSPIERFFLDDETL